MNLPRLPDLGPRTRKALKIAGYVLLGLFSFVYALHLTFPYKRLKDKGAEALASKYDVTVQDVERGWLPGDFSLINVKLATRPTKPGEVPKIIKIDRLDVEVGVLSALTGGVDIGIEAKIGAGYLGGQVTVESGLVSIDLASSNLPLSEVPGLDSVIGMPASGPGRVVAQLELPNNDWRKASGRIAVDCSGCTFGGPGAFFKPKNQASRAAQWAGEGVPVPRLMVSKLSAEWTIGKGKIATKKWVFESPHLQAMLDWEATLEKDIKQARIDNACLRYRGTDDLKKLDEKFYNALELTGGPLGSDNLRHLKLVGTLGSFKALGKECGPGGGAEEVAGDRPRGRPTLDAVPTGEAAVEAGSPATGVIQPQVGDAGALTPKIDDVRIPQNLPEGFQAGAAAAAGSGAGTGMGTGMGTGAGTAAPPSTGQPPEGPPPVRADGAVGPPPNGEPPPPDQQYQQYQQPPPPPENE